jgi:hypothetical protein
MRSMQTVTNNPAGTKTLPAAPPVRPLAELLEAASQARCGQCWAEPGTLCVTLPTLDAPDPSPVPAGGVHVARVGRAMRRGLITGNELLSVLGRLDAFTPATVACSEELAAVVQEALAAPELTREEAAYAHLASFRRGDEVEVNGQPGRVAYAQQPGRTIYEAALLAEGRTQMYVSVRSLLAGWHTITSRADAATGNVRYFDRVTYAGQNPGGAR